MRTFPAFIDVSAVAPLVIGDGALAAAKASVLLKRAPRVTLASKQGPELLAKAIAAGAIELMRREPAEQDIKGRPLVVAATGEPERDAHFARIARDLGVPINVPDRPELCTFAFGAFVERGDLIVGVSTDGAAPMLATHLRAWLERELHPRLGRVAAIARTYRAAARKIPFGVQRRDFWRKALTDAPAEAILRGDEAEGRRLIEALLAGHVDDAPAPAGRVILVGAGPGDPDLLTLGAVRALKSADVVLRDSLGSDEVLDFARRDAMVVDVGKRSGGKSVDQRAINALMIEHAKAGRIVVRLKGGDAFVFGRAAEEIAALEAAGIPVDVMPGISAAHACAADARLPLTYRGKVRQISLVTGSAEDGAPDLDWHDLAQPGKAVAIYMGVRNAARIAARLIAFGADPSKRAVIVENGGRAGSRTIATTLEHLDAAVEQRRVKGPAMLFLGLDWTDAGIGAPAHVDVFARPSEQPAIALEHICRTGKLNRQVPPIDQLALSL